MPTKPSAHATLSHTHEKDGANVTVWPADDDYPDRITVALWAGITTMIMRPTLAETRDLISALQWAVRMTDAKSNG